MLADNDIIPYLIRIMEDNRCDWPTNGASMALLQYAHDSLSNASVFVKLEEAGVYEAVRAYFTANRLGMSAEIRHNLYETLQIMLVGRTKNENILTILND